MNSQNNNEPKLFMFTVPGKPQGKARARTFYNGNSGKMSSVTPEKTVLYENLIKTCFRQKYGQERFSDDAYIIVRITAFFAPPKSVSKKKRAEMLADKIRPAKKPDIDNIAKVVLDALNGIAYHDDTQVVGLAIAKAYSEEPRLEITLGEADNT
mgnify:CR=1 FL=1